MHVRPSPWLWTSLAVVVAVAAALVTYLAVTTPVTVVADGDERTARTSADDVAGALDTVGVELGPDDAVRPPGDAGLVAGATITVVRAATLEVTAHDPAGLLGLAEEPAVLPGVADTVGGLLATANTQAEEGLSRLPALLRTDRVRSSPPPDTPLASGERMEVQLQVAVPVTMTIDDEQHEVHSFAPTVDRLLAEEDVELGEHDRVDPDRRSPLGEVRDVEVTRVEVIEEVEEVTLEHGLERRETDELLVGEEDIATPGEDGLRRDTYEVVLVEGEEESRERIDEEVVDEPVDEVVHIGTAAPAPDPDPDPTPAPPPADGPEVHLTFDDGPNPTYTPQILDLLAAYDARATFFMVGGEVADHPQVAEAVVAAGHTVGNHTWSHARLTEVDEATFARELLDTQQVIEDTVGRAPSCLRPPFGARDGTVNQAAADLGLHMAMWDVDPRDWERPGTEVIVDHVLSEVAAGDVVLFHDGFRDRRQSVAALERILAELSERGYRFTAMPGC